MGAYNGLTYLISIGQYDHDPRGPKEWETIGMGPIVSKHETLLKYKNTFYARFTS